MPSQAVAWWAYPFFPSDQPSAGGPRLEARCGPEDLEP